MLDYDLPGDEKPLTKALSNLIGKIFPDIEKQLMTDEACWYLNEKLAYEQVEKLAYEQVERLAYIMSKLKGKQLKGKLHRNCIQ